MSVYDDAQGDREKALAAITVSARKSSAKSAAWQWAEIAAEHATALGVSTAKYLLGTGSYPELDKLADAIEHFGEGSQVRFFEHREESGYACKLEVGVLTAGVISHIFKIRVKNQGTVGSGNKVFQLGFTLEQVQAEVAAANEIPEGAVCKCGATESYHTRSAVCNDDSEVKEITPEEALNASSAAESLDDATKLFQIVWSVMHPAA